MNRRPKPKGALAFAVCSAALALVLPSCTSSGSGSETTGQTDDTPITIGTTDVVITMDPAGAWGTAATTIQNQVDGFLMNSPYGQSDVEPDLASSAEFTSPNEYTVKLKPGLKFSNGHALTSSDVKFSFDRILTINDEQGPAALLSNLESVSTPDDTTIVFHLKTPNDQIFPQILSGPAGPIVDEEVYSATALTPDEDIVKGDAFSGQYRITHFTHNELITYEANPNYQGVLPKAKTKTINVKYYTDAANMKLDIQQGNIDVAWRSLSATDIDSLRANKDIKVVSGPGGELRYIVFDYSAQPFGAKSDNPDPAKALAVRQAVASLVDRETIATQVYKGTFTPLYSTVPTGMLGANEAFKQLYGDGNGGPSLDKAKAILADAGVTTPVTLKLQYNNEHYGPSSDDEYALVKDQLEAGGLFKVDLQSTEWTQYVKDFLAHVYPMFQLGWFPDYPDPDNYLDPFYGPESGRGKDYVNQTIYDLIAKEKTTADKAERVKAIEEAQTVAAKEILSMLPLLQGTQIAILRTDVTGAQDTLDASFKFRFGALRKG